MVANNSLTNSDCDKPESIYTCDDVRDTECAKIRQSPGAIREGGVISVTGYAESGEVVGEVVPVGAVTNKDAVPVTKENESAKFIPGITKLEDGITDSSYESEKDMEDNGFNLNRLPHRLQDVFFKIGETGEFDPGNFGVDRAAERRRLLAGTDKTHFRTISDRADPLNHSFESFCAKAGVLDLALGSTRAKYLMEPELDAFDLEHSLTLHGRDSPNLKNTSFDSAISFPNNGLFSHGFNRYCDTDRDFRLDSYSYNLNEEIEKRKNAEVLLQKTKQQLSRKEEQYTQELDSKQKTELGMRNLQMELRSKESLIKQLEDEKNEVMRSLAQEKHARALQEQHNEKQVDIQQSISLEAVRQTGQQAAAFDKLEEADENMRSVRETADKLKTELYGTKLELDRLKSRSKDDQKILATENEELTTRIEELKHDIKINEEALAHASMQYTTQLNGLKTENTLLSSNLEKERVAKDKLDSELESLRTRYTHASNELEKTQMARTELERSIQREREEWNRTMDRKDQESNALKDTNQSLYQRVGIAETKLGAVENELSVANTSLLERTAILTNSQRELDQRRSSHDNQEYALRKEKEDNAKLQARLDNTLEKMSTAQHECLSMKQELEAYRSTSSLKDRAAIDSQDKFAELLGTIRTDYDKTRITLEEKNNHLMEQVERYKEELRIAELKRASLEQELRQLQHQHNEVVKKLAVAEAGLENAKQAKESIDAEKVKLRHDVEQFQDKLESAHSRTQEYQARISELVDRLENTETSTQKQNAQICETAHTAQQNRGDLEDLIHKLEIENAKLESSLKHEMERVEMLQRDLQDSNKEETANRSMFAQEAEDSRGLWETEFKSRSKLGLRDDEGNEFHPVDETDGAHLGDDQDIAQLERTKQESVAIAEEEKRRSRKATELKKVAETKMEALQEKNTELQKDVATLKVHLKAAKKRLRMDDVNSQLQQEIDKKEQLESKNRALQQDLNSLQTVEKAYQKLEKAKRKLDEEFAQYKAHVKAHYVERADLERVRQEYEVKARMEVNHKLEEVNAYLEEQAQAREKLDHIRSSNENQLRSEFDRKQKELQEELTKLRAGYQDVMMQKTTKDSEVETLKDMYDNEQKLREKLTNRLFKANDVAVNTKAMLSLERQRMRASNPALFTSNVEANSFLSSPVGASKTTPHFGMNNSDGLSHKIRNELNRSIAKHLEASTMNDVNIPSRTVDDSYLGSSPNKSGNDYRLLLRRKYLL